MNGRRRGRKKTTRKGKRFPGISTGPAAAVTRLVPPPTVPQLSPMRNNEL